MKNTFELEHVGINTDNAGEAEQLALLLCKLFNLEPRHGQKSEFAGNYFECMKSPFLGKNGHIAMRTPDLKAAMEELEENTYLAEFHASKNHLEQMAQLDNRFHELLYEACDSKMLENTLKDFHQYVMRVRRKTLSSEARSTASNNEHRQIMEAIKAKNADLAEELAHQHMINAYNNMLKHRLSEAYREEK